MTPLRITLTRRDSSFASTGQAIDEAFCAEASMLGGYLVARRLLGAPAYLQPTGEFNGSDALINLPTLINRGFCVTSHGFKSTVNSPRSTRSTGSTVKSRSTSG
jgi:hypothetical protein